MAIDCQNRRCILGHYELHIQRIFLGTTQWTEFLVRGQHSSQEGVHGAPPSRRSERCRRRSEAHYTITVHPIPPFLPTRRLQISIHNITRSFSVGRDSNWRRVHPEITRVRSTFSGNEGAGGEREIGRAHV